MADPTPERVSVIVPTRNRRRELRQALASIRSLEGPDLQIDLIVVDNGSVDDSVKVAQEFGALVLHNAVPGAAASRNLGLRSATTEFVAFLDDDDAYLPGHLRPHIRVLRARPECAAVVGRIVLTDADLKHRSAAYPERVPLNGDLFATFLGTYLPQVGATVVRTQVRESIGYFDPDFEGDEDWDWHLRLALRHKVGFVPTECMLFRLRASGTDGDLNWLRLRNTRRVFLRNARRAGRRGPGILSVGRMFLRHNGRFASHFADDARRCATDGNARGALIGWLRAALSSPPHAILQFIRPGHNAALADRRAGQAPAGPASPE